ncbi:MAG: DegV family protein [Clostridia bacterium]|nr:DegV family protein [Clostridia bacterium]
MNYKIVADSSSNVYTLEDIPYSCVPLKVNIGDTEYIDTPEADIPKMVQELKTTKEKTRTSCPNIYDWQEAFSGADNIFAVTITSGLSGSYTSAMNAKKLYQETSKDTKIHIIDSLSAGPELKLIIEKLKEFINKKLPFEEIKEKIEEYKKRTRLFFCLESLTNFARNGRVSPALAQIVGLLGIRIVGTASSIGTLEPLSKPRGEKKALLNLYEHIKSAGFRGGKVRIAHCRNESFANELKKSILGDFPSADIEISPCGVLCSYYAEIGGLLVAVES